MNSSPWFVAGMCLLALSVWENAGGQTTYNPRNNTNYNQQRGSTTFVGTISSINVSNRTIEVRGADSYVVTTYQYNQNNRNNSSTYVNNKPKRTLEAAGKEGTRKFEVSGFCKIETDDTQEGKIGTARKTLADLKEGDRVSIEYMEGIGGHYTAKFIQPLAALNVTDPQKNEKNTQQKKKPKN